MLTTEEFINAISGLVNTPVTDEQAEIIERLKGEREEIEKFYNGENEKVTEWETKYNNLHDDYIKRFFSGSENSEIPENSENNENVEIKNIDEIIKSDD